VVFNPHPWAQDEVVRARVWNRSFADGEIAVFDEQGRALPAQVLERKPYWWMEHHYTEIAFPAAAIPALGWRTFTVARVAGASALPLGGAATCSAVLEGRSKQGAEVTCTSFAKPVFAKLANEFLEVEVEQASGAIVHLIDRRTGVDLVPAGQRLGLLSYVREVANGMTAWHIGQVVEDIPLNTGWMIDCVQGGPFLGVIRAKRSFKDSAFTVDISLAARVPRLDIQVKVDWLERGSAALGMPTLRMRFPLALTGGTATYECPNGHVARPMDGTWVPGQRWVDITGHHAKAAGQVGATLANDSSYGFCLADHAITVALLRSSYDPDPLPELGEHTFRFAIVPHVGAWTASDATRAGAQLNVPLNVVATDEHPGALPASQAGAEILTRNVMLSGLKQAEDSAALIVRLYEMEGRATTAQIRLAPALAAADAPAVETDLNEQPLTANTATMRGGVLSVQLPPFGTATVRVG
jgi:alpha-mannosidase